MDVQQSSVWVFDVCGTSIFIQVLLDAAHEAAHVARINACSNLVVCEKRFTAVASGWDAYIVLCDSKALFCSTLSPPVCLLWESCLVPLLLVVMLQAC